MRILKYTLLLGLLVALPLFNVKANKSSKVTLIKDEAFLKEFRKLKLELIQVFNDPIYGGTRCYSGVPLKEVINLVAKKNKVDISKIDKFNLKVIAEDGTVEELDLNNPKLSSGYIAIGTNKLCSNEKDFETLWEPVVVDKRRLSPGPNALVWSGFSPRTKKLPVVFSVEGFSLNKIVAPEADIPPKLSGVFGGFELFKKHCKDCHSINKVGGIEGLELNVPLNVTEYMDMDWVRNITRNAPAVRWGSKMPSFMHLDEADIDQIIKYISIMRSSKVCYSEKSCAEKK